MNTTPSPRERGRLDYRWGYLVVAGGLILMLVLPPTRYLAIGCCITAVIILGLRAVAYWDPDEPSQDAQRPRDQDLHKIDSVSPP